jgi:hypothetical protein
MPAFAKVFASGAFFNAPYIGAEVIQTNQNYKQGYGEGVYRKNPQFYSAFLGFKFNRCLGLEGGYEFQPKVTKTVTLGQGQSEPGRGTIVAPTTSVGMHSSIKGYHPYLGIFIETDQPTFGLNKLKLQAMVGASYSRIKAQDVITSINGVPANVVNNYSKYKLIPMVKLIAAHNLTNNLGMRVSLNFHNFQKFKIKAQDGGTGEIKLKNTVGVGLGLTYSFC